MTDYLMGLITGAATAMTAYELVRLHYETKPVGDPPAWINRDRGAA